MSIKNFIQSCENVRLNYFLLFEVFKSKKQWTSTVICISLEYKEIYNLYLSVVTVSH